MNTICSCKNLVTSNLSFFNEGKKKLFFRKIKQGTVNSPEMVRDKRFRKFCEQCKIRPINPIALQIFSVNTHVHFVGRCPSPLFCSHPHLCETRITSPKMFCFRHFHFSVHEFLISSLCVLQLSISLVPFIESSFQSSFNCTGDLYSL